MIGSLRGTLLDRSPTEVVIDVHGVGYRVLVSPATLAVIGDLGTTVVLFTHLHVREDALTLYGFPTLDERSCFEALLGAHGVGPALALAILAVHRPTVLRQAVAYEDVFALCLVPGVGKKIAASLLLELKARLDVPEGDVLAIISGGRIGPLGEVREALAALGYGPEEIRDALRELPDDGDVPRLLKDALGRMGAVR
jgi:Holliday junction DNA helicase RuvA